MSFTYTPLWKMLIDKNMTKEDMRKELGLSPATVAKMGKGENVSLDVIDRICNYFNCEINEIIEHVKERE